MGGCVLNTLKKPKPKDITMTSDEMKLILTKLDTLERAVLQLVAKGNGPVGTASPDTARPIVATAAELDGQWGDPLIRSRDPKSWTGDSMMGLKLSACPPEYLDLWAERADYFARQADEKGEKDNKGRPASYWKRKDAALARGWAARKRAGWTAPVATTESEWPESSF
jgi:hypothetical protein